MKSNEKVFGSNKKEGEKIVESIPNISEGRDKKIIEECVDQIRSTKGCTLLNYSSDESHNRSVITYIGSPEACREASIKLTKKAIELIDLNKQKGEHPRVGCVDVMPLVPIKNITIEECVELSRKIGKEIGETLNLPVFLYEESANFTERKNLANIRRGEFEGFKEKIKEKKWKPDFGKKELHPTGGVICIGAREPLIAYNINLNTMDISIAKKIAEEIRESGGGLKGIKALGIMLEEPHVAQVSINIVDYKENSFYQINEFVKEKCSKYGIEILETELIGLSPMKALVDSAAKYLQIKNFDSDIHVIESHLI